MNSYALSSKTSECNKLQKYLNAEAEASASEDKKAHAAIEAMASVDPVYWGQVLASRLADDGSGSRTEFTRASDLQEALNEAVFSSYEHPDVSADTIAFKCDIPGFIGVAPICPTSRYVLEDPKRTGRVSAVLSLAPGVTRRHKVDFSVLICGTEEGRLVAFTFHPGAPVRASAVPAAEYLGRNVTGVEALSLGLTHAKV